MSLFFIFYSFLNIINDANCLFLNLMGYIYFIYSSMIAFNYFSDIID